MFVQPLDSGDQLSSISVTEMLGYHDTQEDEVYSMDIGQGSTHEVDTMHDIDDMVAPEENNLQIIPWEMRVEVTSAVEISEEQNIYMHRVWTCKKENSIVTDDIKKKWDPLWREINEEFESELKGQSRFAELSDHMFYVWEGNHRTLAWTEAIKEKFSTSKEKHCRVLCTIIDPTKVPEIALLSSLQRMNVMNTHALVANHLRDEIVNTNHICAADHESYLVTLPEKDQKLIATVRRKYATKGTEPWYPLTRRYLGMLVFDVQITKEKASGLSQLGQQLSEEEKNKDEENINREIVHKYQERIGKLLNIVDPNLGTDWGSCVSTLAS
ncbi:hypothetical protein GOP47_0029950 [Adiantum capillus-veneris]|nr:hypothetical protein GOP47_0029950 [Adiantum capillus-veneris]